MKAIFTGTEQDLIECGFIRYINFVYPKLYKKRINFEEELRVCIGKHYHYYIYDKKYINNGKEIWKHNNRTNDINCIFNYVDKKLIQDLIDKNLIRWE